MITMHNLKLGLDSNNTILLEKVNLSFVLNRFETTKLLPGCPVFKTKAVCLFSKSKFTDNFKKMFRFQFAKSTGVVLSLHYCRDIA